MKGISPIISEMLLLTITISILSYSSYIYFTTIHNAEKVVENKGAVDYCKTSSNFVIKDVSGKNITIWNNGGSKLNVSYFNVYVNNIPVSFNYTTEILERGNSTVLILNELPPPHSKIKIIGECDTADLFVVR